MFAILLHVLQCHKLGQLDMLRFAGATVSMVLYSALRQLTWQPSMHDQRICTAWVLTVSAARLHLDRTYCVIPVSLSNITDHHGVTAVVLVLVLRAKRVAARYGRNLFNS